MKTGPGFWFLVLFAVFGSVWPPSGFAQDTRDERRKIRCVSYREMIGIALANVDGNALTKAFLERHEAFVASDCSLTVPVCPKSPADFAFADLLTMMTVSANMGSTFTPFRCPVGEGR